jgi:perosamine synthetase
MIPVFRPPLLPEVESRVVECLRSTWWGYGKECHNLERRFVSHHGGGWALATSTGTSALYIAARLLGADPGDEVIIPAMTFVSTPMSFLSAGLSVRLADVDPETLMVTADTIKPLITERTRAIVVVHLYGQRAALRGLRSLCDDRDIYLIEDCAHRLDLDDEGHPVGDMTCYSFNAVKEAPGGEGGLIWGRDVRQEGHARSISNVGLGVDTWQRSSTLSHADYQFRLEAGLKLRLNDIAASVINTLMEHRLEFCRKRAALFKRYDQFISGLPRQAAPIRRSADDSFLMYVIRVNEGARQSIRSALANEGIATSVHYPSLSTHPLVTQPTECPIADKASNQLLTLPCFPDLQGDDQERVISALDRIMKTWPIS